MLLLLSVSSSMHSTSVRFWNLDQSAFLQFQLGSFFLEVVCSLSMTFIRTGRWSLPPSLVYIPLVPVFWMSSLAIARSGLLNVFHARERWASVRWVSWMQMMSTPSIFRNSLAFFLRSSTEWRQAEQLMLTDDWIGCLLPSLLFLIHRPVFHGTSTKSPFVSLHGHVG